MLPQIIVTHVILVFNKCCEKSTPFSVKGVGLLFCTHCLVEENAVLGRVLRPYSHLCMFIS